MKSFHNQCNSSVRAELKSVSSVKSVVEKEVYSSISAKSFHNQCNSSVRAELKSVSSVKSVVEKRRSCKYILKDFE